jgi:capsule polysaccharide export protein KpsE/RkpR
LEAQQRLDRAQQASAAEAQRAPAAALQSQIEGDVDLASKVRQSLIDARGDLAEYQEKPEYARQVPGLRARVAELEKRANDLEKGIEQTSAVASQRAASRQKLDGEVKMAQTASETSATRLRDLRAIAGTRGERLRVIDPGIVPQRPSSPNVALNVFAALFLTLIALTAYLTVSFRYRRRVQ